MHTFAHIYVHTYICSCIHVPIHKLVYALIGKEEATNSILSQFGSGSSYFIKPSFIYGGDVFTLNPPRVANFYGQFIDSLLSSMPVRAVASISPPILKVALVPPVSVDHIAQATAASALGLVDAGAYDGSDEINAVAKKMGHF